MSEPQAYTPSTIETRWQQQWQDSGAFTARDDLPREQCYYVLEMFPYPSGKLHMGHVRNYSIGDAVARYKRMCGLHVLHPMGWDSFGLPAEQAAIDRGLHPKGWTYDNISHMRGQLQRMGFSYDWSREFATSDDQYAAFEQQLVLDLVEEGLVYRKSATVNWSTGLNTVLANEQVIDGTCWRTGAPVIQKELPQWFFRITNYADELLDGIDGLTDWPEAVRIMQRNWLGKSTGAEIDFAVEGHEATVTIFTTRPDTVFGVTFMSIAPEHALLDTIVTQEQRSAIEAFRAELAEQSTDERTGEDAPKKGVFTGAYAINPVNGERVPVYAANFVLADYGTGAVMAVPAHDTRDFAFAREYDLPIKPVIIKDDAEAGVELTEAFTAVGTMTDSGPFTGQRSDAAKAAIIDWLAEQGHGRAQATWRLRDWLVSRQRYWGNPIPFLYGETMGAVPVRAKDLPVTLPEDVNFDGIGNPLEKHASWATHAADGSELSIQTGTGNEPARRETDTMDTFVQSSWYFARYTCADSDQPLDAAKMDHWLPVDLYVGGIEHACLHLLYARFFQKALADAGYSSVREPFKRLLCQGMVVAETYYRDKGDGTKEWFNPADVDAETDAKGAVIGATLKADGQPVVVGRVEKMSKSKNNGVDPQQIIDEYGADTARLFILSDVPPTKDLLWDDAGVAGSFRFLKRLWTAVHDALPTIADVAAFADGKAELTDAADKALLKQVHAATKRASQAMEEDFGFNVAIAECRTLFNAIDLKVQSPALIRRGLETLVQLLAPMVPHIAAELWQHLGHDDSLEAAGWPSYDEAELVEDEVEYPVQINGKVRGKVSLPNGLTKPELEALVADSAVIAALIDGKTLRKAIVVPGRIVNLVVG
ncbi:MAG: leucine--tRNA ligase [Planctomycetota bacterium]|jgi:leucyl-tRNA synthetase